MAHSFVGKTVLLLSLLRTRSLGDEFRPMRFLHPGNGSSCATFSADGTSEQNETVLERLYARNHNEVRCGFLQASSIGLREGHGHGAACGGLPDCFSNGDISQLRRFRRDQQRRLQFRAYGGPEDLLLRFYRRRHLPATARALAASFGAE